MAQSDKIQLFEDKRIRTAWDAEKEEWYFSIVDVVAVLTDSPNPQTYWRVLKKRLKDEGNETVTSCNALKMTAADGKRRLTDVADTEQLLRIIQSIPSPKAEPFKLWLAQVGRERIEETIDPELTIDRALETYLKKGYTREWINQRLQAIQVRKELTDEWDCPWCTKRRGVRYPHGRDFPRMVGDVYPPVQKPERLEKGKPSGQHDNAGVGVEYAGGGNNHTVLKRSQADNFPRKSGSCQSWRSGRRTDKKRH